MIEADSGRYNNTVNFTHDDAGRVRQESLTVASQTYAVKSEYDAASRKTKITYPDGSLVIRDYTGRNQLEDVKYDANGAGTLPPLPVV